LAFWPDGTEQSSKEESFPEDHEFKRRTDVMKSHNVVANVGSTSKSVAQSNVTEVETPKSRPTREEIRQRAYEIHIERGGIHGCDLDDWLQAERELEQKYRSSEKEGKKK
jgi:hypothetical protein